MHLLLCLILSFNDFEANPPVSGFNGSESICNRVDHLAFSTPVIYQDRQMDKSLTSGAHDAYVTLDISHPIFSIARVVYQGHTVHFGGDTPGLCFNVNTDNLNEKEKNPWILGKCLGAFFLSPVEGRRERRSGEPPDWGQ